MVIKYVCNIMNNNKFLKMIRESQDDLDKRQMAGQVFDMLISKNPETEVLV